MRISIIILAAIACLTTHAANPRGAGGVRVVAETNGVFTITSENSSYSAEMWAFLQLAGKDFRVFGGNGDGTTDNAAAWTNAMERLSDGDTLLIAGGTYVLDTVEISKDINIVGINGGTLKHKDNATGHMLNFTEGVNAEIRGITFDANDSNQGTNTTYAVIYANGGTSGGLKIHKNTFNGFMKATILDYQTQNGKVEIVDNFFSEGYKVPLAATNIAVVNSAIWLSPGFTNNAPQFIVSRNRAVAAADDDTERRPGFFVAFGNEDIGHINTIEVTHNHIDGYGGDTVAVAHHVGIAALDVYQHNKGIVGWNVVTNTHFWGVKNEQNPELLVIGNRVHGHGTGLYKLTPGERDQVTPHRFQVMRDNYAYKGTNDSIALYISSGASGQKEVTVDGFNMIGDFARGIQLTGLLDDGTSSDGLGPYTFRNIHGTVSNYGLWVLNTSAKIKLEDYFVNGTGNGNSIVINRTNATSAVFLDNVHTSVENGTGALIQGVALVSIKGSSFAETGSGSAITIAADATGNRVGYLDYGSENKITGSSSITSADIDAGFYRNGTTTTVIPSGLTMGPSATRLWKFQYDTNTAANILDIQNNTSGGAALFTVRSDTATLTAGAYSDAYSDSARQDRAEIRAESNAASMDITSVAGSVRAKTLDESQPFDVLIGGSVFARVSTNGFTIKEQAGAATPSSGFGLFYTKTDNYPYFKNDAGTEYNLVAGVVTNIVGLALGDMTTTITAGNNKAYWVAPYDGTVVGVFGSLFTASGSGGVQFDVNKNGTSILSTKLTVDATETTSITAATNAVISSANFSAGDRFAFDIDVEGSSAVGPQINMGWIRR